jgi:hypothetical protein
LRHYIAFGDIQVKKTQAELAIRQFATQWLDTLPVEERDQPSFSAFKDWLRQHGHSHYLDFQSVAGAEYDAGTWFDDELGQNWRR